MLISFWDISLANQTGERGLMAYRVFPDTAILLLILVLLSSSNILGTVEGEEREVCEGGVCDSSEASMWADEEDAAGGQCLLALSFLEFSPHSLPFSPSAHQLSLFTPCPPGLHSAKNHLHSTHAYICVFLILPLVLSHKESNVRCIMSLYRS